MLMGLPFDYAIDMWSAGIVLCEIWTGRPLFTADTQEELVQKMMDVLGPLPANVYAHGKFFDPAFNARPIRANQALRFDLTSEVE